MYKKYLFTLSILITLSISACGLVSAPTLSPANAEITEMALAWTSLAMTQAMYPISTPFPSTPTLMPTSTPTIPYPTASVVKANAVAFIAENALWIANVDGSGERKLVDLKANKRWIGRNLLLQWSPDGKWISHVSGDELWIVSRDGSEKRKLLSLPETREFFIYAWSPDSSKIAYLKTGGKLTITPTPRPEGGESGIAPYLVGMIDIETGNVSELSSFEANAGIPVLLWSPNGRDLLFIKDYSLVLFDVVAHKIIKTIKRGCGLERGLSWSPNGRWFSYTDNGVGGFNPTWICVNSAAGDSIQTVRVDSTSFNPVWDKTGNYIYFLASKIDLTRKSDPLIDERLMRYGVRTQKTESLLSLKELQQPNSYIRSLSISPDGNTLLLQSPFSKTKFDLFFVNSQSLATTKFTVDFEDLKVPFLYSYILETAWSPDSQNLILFAGDFCTPSGCGGWGPLGYGSFYTLNTKTGKVSIFSGEHSIYSWQVSPIATTP